MCWVPMDFTLPMGRVAEEPATRRGGVETAREFVERIARFPSPNSPPSTSTRPRGGAGGGRSEKS